MTLSSADKDITMILLSCLDLLGGFCTRLDCVIGGNNLLHGRIYARACAPGERATFVQMKCADGGDTVTLS